MPSAPHPSSDLDLTPEEAAAIRESRAKKAAEAADRAALQAILPRATSASAG
jgi:hypothetical protein